MDALTVLLSVGVFIAGVGTVLTLFTLSSRGDQDARDAPTAPSTKTARSSPAPAGLRRV